jgi:peptide/nickel transport system permease protein
VKKTAIYIIAFFFAVSLLWLVINSIPGSPLTALIASGVNPFAISQLSQIFGLSGPTCDIPPFLYKIIQFITYWSDILHGNLGRSIVYFPRTVLSIVLEGLPYDVLLIVPSTIIAWWVGNKLGALAATHPRLDRIVMPVFYVLNAAPYFWLGLMLIYALSVEYPIFPATGAYSGNMLPNLSFSFVLNFLWHLVLPVLSFVIVGIGGWGLGMRNLMIYELGANYSKYLEAMGGSKNLITSYAFKNAELPQITGLALSFGNIIAGALGIEVVFGYPGVAYILYRAIIGKDIFLAIGGFFFVVVIVLVANFLVDILYGFIDPRIKYTYTEGG